jgi:uncharacterized protein YbjT (DUF2867 family)
MTILVTGGRGAIAREVVRGLLDAGVPVRAASREPAAAALPAGVQPVLVDPTRPDTLKAALDGVDKLFLYANPDGIGDVIDASRAAGVRHLVLLSSLAAGQPGADDNPIGARHLAVERPIADSGLPWTFVRPGMFATNHLGWAASIKAEGVVRAAYPEAHAAAIHERDMADVAVAALTGDGHEHQAYTLTGPESQTQRQRVEIIAAAIGRPVRFEEQTPEEAREAMLRFMPAGVVDVLLSYQAASNGVPAEVLDTTERITGHPARTFAQWATDHAEDFSR